MNETSSGPDLMNDLAHEFAERFRRGERPSLTEYTARYPDLEAEIRDLFPALAVIEQFGSVAGPPTGPHAQLATAGDAVPRQLEDVSKFPMITQELLNRGFKKDDILKILGGNLLRAMKEAEKAAGK